MRRIAKFLTAVVCVGAVMASTVDEASAFGYDEETRGLFEVKLGPYMPMIDEGLDNDPYDTFFEGRAMLYGEVEYDYHLWRQFGTLSIGLHAGYGRVSAEMIAPEVDDVDIDDESALRNIPLKSSLVYRYDYSAHNHGIPLVPVAKAGLNYNFWRVTDADGETVEIDGQRGSGGKAGWHATLGLHLHLDFFDPRSSASMEMGWGVSNSFLFAEYTWTRIGGFGDGGLDLSANHWAAGLTFEF